MWHFDKAEMHRAKDVLGRECTIMDNVPITLIFINTPDQVTDHCRRVGFILSSGCQVDSYTDENIKALINTANTHLHSKQVTPERSGSAAPNNDRKDWLLANV